MSLLSSRISPLNLLLSKCTYNMDVYLLYKAEEGNQICDDGPDQQDSCKVKPDSESHHLGESDHS